MSSQKGDAMKSQCSGGGEKLENIRYELEHLKVITITPVWLLFGTSPLFNKTFDTVETNWFVSRAD